MGILVEGKPARDTIADINKGSFKDKILQGKSELTAEELKALDEERKRLQTEIEVRRKEYEIRAKAIMTEMAGKSSTQIKNKMREVKIPESIIKELLPAETKEAAPGAKPAAGGAKPSAK